MYEMAKDPEKQREAARRHYEKNREAIIVRAREFTVLNREKLREYIRQVKSQACMDCGVSYPSCVMDFDHRDSKEKESNVASMIARSVGLERLKKEIEKCDVVCANCHRARTFGAD